LIKTIFKIGIFILFLLLPNYLLGVQTDIQKLINRGDSALFIQKNDEARNLYDRAGILAEQKGVTYYKYLSIYKIAYSYLREDADFLSLAYFTQIQMDFSPVTKQDSALYFLVSLENDIISFNCIKSKYKPSLIEQYAYRYIAFLGRNEKNRLLYLLAAVYEQRLEHKLAIEKYSLFIKQQIADPWLYELSIFKMANQYKELLEYQQAIEYFRLLLEKNRLYISELVIWERIAYCYYYQRNYNNAIKYLKYAAGKYKEGQEVRELVINYTSQGSCNLLLGNKEQAKIKLHEAEYLALSAKVAIEELYYVYLSELYFYKKISDSILVQEYLKICESKIKLLNKNSILYVEANVHITNYYIGINDYIRTIKKVNEFDSIFMPELNLKNENQSYHESYRKLLLNKALSLRKLWECDSAHIELLQQAYETFNRILKVSQEMYLNMEQEASKLQVLKNLREDYENLFLATNNFYSVKKYSKYLDELFLLQQKGKATLFKEIMQESEALYSSTIPERILKIELEIRKQIERLDYYVNSSTSENIGEDIIGELREELIYAKLSHDSLVKIIEKESPIYSKQKKIINEYSLDDVKEIIDESQVVLDYFLREGRLFLMLITKTECFLVESDVQGDIQQDLLDYRSMLQNNPFDKPSGYTYNKFISLSHKLYTTLLHKVEQHLKGKRLIVIPDKELNLVPFETLLTEYVDTNLQTAFADLPFLLKHNPVTVLYSESQLFDKVSKLKRGSKILSFAPDYSNINDSNLVPIPGTQEEVVRISSYFKSKTYLGGEATKKKFRLESQKNYDIIHLALHTIISDNNPKYSQMAFSFAGNAEDTYLTTYEVIGDRYKADLLVLSGCNTGSGKFRSGEGVMHLARSFFFAGIKNIILTQWAVADKSSATIMESFYKYLHEGNSVDVALQKAKIDFLLYGDPLKHHPYYWAGYVNMGNPAEFESKSFLSRYWYLSILGFVLIMLAIIKRNKH
jgi:CHAT domain-containing protein